MKVFLGGTCNGWNWRNKLQSLLKCEYYNPIVENWTEEDRLREVHERETCDYVLYGITNDMRGVYSIAEVVDDSNKRPQKTIFLNLYADYGTNHTHQMNRSIKAVENLLKTNGAKVFYTIESVAEFLNNKNDINEVCINELRFCRTCVCSPEQYDVYDKNGNPVGYVRLRWGELSCRYPNASGEEIFHTAFSNEWVGMFENDDQRNHYLSIIANRILARMDGYFLI